MSQVQLRVLLVDDSDAFRAGFCTALASNDEVQIVGEARDGDEALKAAEVLQPDVVIMDLSMPGLDGIEATRRLVQRSPHIAVLVLSMFDDDESVFAAMRAGARGYLVKGARRQEIVRALTAVGAGEAIFGPAVARRISDYFGNPAPPSAPSDDPFPELTDRERQILEMMATGQNNTSIAQRLSLSPKTVRNHASNIFSKLLVADRAQAIIRAREAGLGHTGT